MEGINILNNLISTDDGRSLINTVETVYLLGAILDGAAEEEAALTPEQRTSFVQVFTAHAVQ